MMTKLNNSIAYHICMVIWYFGLAFYCDATSNHLISTILIAFGGLHLFLALKLSNNKESK